MADGNWSMKREPVLSGSRAVYAPGRNQDFAGRFAAICKLDWRGP